MLAYCCVCLLFLRIVVYCCQTLLIVVLLVLHVVSKCFVMCVCIVAFLLRFVSPHLFFLERMLLLVVACCFILSPKVA